MSNRNKLGSKDDLALLSTKITRLRFKLLHKYELEIKTNGVIVKTDVIKYVQGQMDLEQDK